MDSEELRRLSAVGSAAIPTPTVVEDTVGTAPSPATTGTSLTPVSVTGYPDPATDGAFEVLCYAPDDIPSADATEVLRVTALAAGVWTIERQQYDSPALSIAAGWLLRWTADAMALDLRAYLEVLALETAIAESPPAVMKRTVYTSGSGTHTYDTDTVTVNIRICGAGGAGGDADGPGVGSATAGGGGGGGGVAEKMFLKGSDTSASYTFSGGGGAVEVDPGTPTTLIANKGTAGNPGVASPGAAAGGAGGTASGGDMNSTGQAGGGAINAGSTQAMSGTGGSSVMGGGGVGRITITSGGGSNGGTGGNYGGGGGGAVAGLTGGSRTGGAGGGAIVIIDEYGIGV